MAIKEYAEYAIAGLLGLVWFDLRALRRTYMTKKNHDELCDLKLHPINEDIAEIKADVKELLKRNGGPRT